MVDRFQIGVIAGTHGVKGDVKIFPTTDDPARFKKLKTVILAGRKSESVVAISNVRLSGKFVIARLQGIDDMDKARLLRESTLWIPREDAVPLPPGKYYVPDLIGISVRLEDGSVLGELTDVIFTGANDVYQVTTPDGRNVLLPVIDDCIIELKPEEGYAVVRPLPGLLDIYL